MSNLKHPNEFQFQFNENEKENAKTKQLARLPEI